MYFCENGTEVSLMMLFTTSCVAGDDPTSEASD